MEFPKSSATREWVSNEIDDALAGDADWRGGRIWSLVYFAGDDVAEVITDAYAKAIYTNGLGPAAFRSLKRFESEVMGMTADLLGLPAAVGNITSGGTESILMAVKTARDSARAERGITEPEIVVPVTAHPAFDKAGQYLGVKVVRTPLRADLRADPDAIRGAVTVKTVLIVGSAPCYPFGLIDPITEIADLAQERGVLCHVDACVGGYLLPFVKRLGYRVPAWDFSVPGVTSISADLHKYGYAARGASSIMYRDVALRRYQHFVRQDWPGGSYGSPTLAGSRPGGAVAAAWAVMNYLGAEGYTRLAKVIMDTTRSLIDGVNSIRGLEVLGEPDMSLFAFSSDSIDVYAVADALAPHGWFPDRQHSPPSLHCMVTPVHKDAAEPFLDALRQAVESARTDGATTQASSAVYGMAAEGDPKR